MFRFSICIEGEVIIFNQYSIYFPYISIQIFDINNNNYYGTNIYGFRAKHF